MKLKVLKWAILFLWGIMCALFIHVAGSWRIGWHNFIADFIASSLYYGVGLLVVWFLLSFLMVAIFESERDKESG